MQLILDRLPQVTVPQARMMRALWEGGDRAVRERGWQLGRQILVRHGGEQALQEANDAVSRWLRDYAGGNIGQPYVLYSEMTDQMRLESRIDAAPPILDAILASLVGAELPDDEREELLGPWELALDAGHPTDGGPPPDDAPETHDSLPDDSTEQSSGA